MFIGRESELNLIQNKIDSKRFEFGILYGRRRIGKTRLLTEVAQRNKVIYYVANESGAEHNLSMIGSVVADYFNEPVSFSDFSRLLEYIAQKAISNKIILIIDEFTYLLTKSEGLLSVFQNAIDQHMINTDMTFILSGSHVGMVEEAISYQKPLYARSTFKLNLKPFDYFDSAKFYPGFSNEDKIRTYSIFGGIPFYLEKIDYTKSLRDNIIDLTVVAGAAFEDEIMFFLRQELRSISSYGSIISAIASGATRLNEITFKSNVNDTGAASKYIDTLIGLGIIEREICFGEKPNSRKTIYRIKDHFFHFYYEFIESNKSKMAIISKELFYDLFINPKLEEYVSFKFEIIAREFLIRKNLSNTTEDIFVEIGRYWGNSPILRQEVEIDIVTKTQNGNTAYECKWTNDLFRLDVVNNLKEKSRHLMVTAFGGFSRSGYTRDAKENLDICYTVDDLYSGI
jgi:AAA+ ATPase superfamily predicted ATPase